MSASSKNGFVAMMGSLLGLSTIATGLRLLARKHQRQPIKADDYFAILGWAMYLVAVTCEFRMVSMKRLGYSYSEMTQAATNPRIADRWALTWDVAAAIVSSSYKLSALFLYKRIFRVPGRRSVCNTLCNISIVVLALWTIAYVILPFLQCGTHLDALWTGKIGEYCDQVSTPYYLSLPSTNFALDLWVLLLPIPFVIRLHMTTSRKVSVIGVFLLAFLSFGASIARLVIYCQIVLGGAEYVATHDYGRAQTRGAFMTMLEAGIALVAVNLPSLWLYISKIAPEKVLASVRSMVSLSSINSNRSRGSGHSRRLEDEESKTITSDAGITKKTEFVATHPSESATALHQSRTSSQGELENYHAEIYSTVKS